MERILIRDMPWAKAKDWLAFLAHDDKRDIGNIGIALQKIEKSEKAKNYPSLLNFFSTMATELESLHSKFRPFRCKEKEPSKAELDRYLLDYHARLDFFSNQYQPKLEKAKSAIAKIPDLELRTALEKIVQKSFGIVGCGHIFNSLFLDFSPVMKRENLKQIVEEYIKDGVIDREGHPVKVIIEGADVFAFCDRRMLESSLANLLTDAINHTPGRPLFIRIGRKGNFGMLSVTSQGKRLTNEEMTRIGVVRYSRSNNPDRGWGKVGVNARLKLMGGKLGVGNSQKGPKLTMFLPRKKTITRRAA